MPLDFELPRFQKKNKLALVINLCYRVFFVADLMGARSAIPSRLWSRRAHGLACHHTGSPATICHSHPSPRRIHPFRAGPPRH